MLKVLRENRKNILFAVMLTFVFYMFVGPIVYFNDDFQNYISSKNSVLGVDDYERGNINEVLDEFLSHVEDGNYREIEETTGLKGKITFSQWHEIRSIDIVGGWVYEDAHTALIRVDFNFWVNEQAFDYPLTLVFVMERIGGDWVVNDVEYTLERYNEALE